MKTGRLDVVGPPLHWRLSLLALLVFPSVRPYVQQLFGVIRPVRRSGCRTTDHTYYARETMAMVRRCQSMRIGWSGAALGMR